MYEDLSDSELVRRFSEGDRQAFEALCDRHDKTVLRAIRQEFRGRADWDHPARELADSFWQDLSSHAGRLLRHDYSRRSLGAYLADLARRQAKRFLDKLRKKEAAHPEPPIEQDFGDPLPEIIECWDRVVELLSPEQLTRLRSVLAKKKLNDADRAWKSWLIRKLREQLGLPPRHEGRRS
jgi:hypothetical protein